MFFEMWRTRNGGERERKKLIPSVYSQEYIDINIIKLFSFWRSPLSLLSYFCSFSLSAYGYAILLYIFR